MKTPHFFQSLELCPTRFSNHWNFSSLAAGLLATAASAAPFGIEVVDAETGRGIPLVELTTTHHVKYVTDNAGLVAFDEPGLLGTRVFFSIKSPGYVSPRDGFGSEGVAFDTKDGGFATVKLARTNIAERLYRITGAGLYRDSLLLGRKAPLPEPLLNAGVVGQDSAQVAVYGGAVRWFWGDTTPAKYPLGNFHTTGATSELPGRGGLAPSVGIALRYEDDGKGFVCKMLPDLGEGIVWIDGLCTVPDRDGRARLVCHYSRRKGLAEELGHGLAVFDDAKRHFVRVLEFEAANRWRHPAGQATVRDGRVWFANPLPTVRASATFEALQDPAAYEALDAKGAWSKADAPAKILFRDAVSGAEVKPHAGSARWNAFRKCWIWIGNQEHGRASYLGEVWYAEAPAPEGPWTRAVQIATHPKYSFYNPVHHDFLDEQGGRIVYFEGTYCATFSGNESPTPRYDYNQLLYRLDLDHPRLRAAR